MFVSLFGHLVCMFVSLFDHLVCMFVSLFDHLVCMFVSLFGHLVCMFVSLFDHLVCMNIFLSGRHYQRLAICSNKILCLIFDILFCAFISLVLSTLCRRSSTKPLLTYLRLSRWLRRTRGNYFKSEKITLN